MTRGRAYTAIVYHRIAGELKPGQERLDVPPRRFARQLRLLQRLGFTALSEQDLLAFHEAHGRLPRRAYVLTADDAFVDCLKQLVRYPAHRPHLFVPTAAVGGPADWLGGERVADWESLRAGRRAGVSLGGHGTVHVDLTTLRPADVLAQVGESRSALERETGAAPALFAYPHGRHNTAVREAVAAAGYRLAFTTTPGRNGRATEPFALRRLSVKAWDSNLSFLWKVLTGSPVPSVWERWLLLRHRIERLPGPQRRFAPRS
jgi:peptidoglycan/xylan/chitin deacetylase (PgdA/CDA1 family)